MDLEKPQNNESVQLDALMKSIGGELVRARNQEETDLIIDKGFKSLLVFIPDVDKAGKVMDRLINTYREELNKKGIQI